MQRKKLYFFRLYAYLEMLFYFIFIYDSVDGVCSAYIVDTGVSNNTLIYFFIPLHNTNKFSLSSLAI